MKLKTIKLKTLSCALLALVLAALTPPASAYTVYKTVSFGSDQTGQTVTYTVKTGAGVVLTTGVSGAVVEMGGGAYAAPVTVPDGAGYFITWTDPNAGAPLTASDVIAQPLTSLTVSGYAAGQDPATLLLTTPANKLATTNAGAVTTANPSAGGPTAADFWAYSNRSLTDKTGFQTIDSMNKYTYNASTKTLQKLKDDGTNLGAPLQLIIDSAGNILSRR